MTARNQQMMILDTVLMDSDFHSHPSSLHRHQKKNEDNDDDANNANYKNPPGCWCQGKHFRVTTVIAPSINAGGYN